MTDQESLRKRAEKRIKRRQEYYGHVASYVFVNVLVWGIYVFTTLGGFPWPIFVTLGWGIGLAFDTMDYLTNSPEKREDAIAKEMARIAAQEGFAKPKREQVARLSSDGEIVYDEESEEGDDSEPVYRAKRKA